MPTGHRPPRPMTHDSPNEAVDQHAGKLPRPALEPLQQRPGRSLALTGPEVEVGQEEATARRAV